MKINQNYQYKHFLKIFPSLSFCLYRKWLLTIAGLFVASVSFSQSWQWGRYGTCTFYCEGMAGACDYQGNAVIVGTGSNIIFGQDTILPSIGGGYMVKYDGSGHVIWAKEAAKTPTSGVLFWDVTVDKEGNEYIAGYFDDTVTFGSTTFRDTSGSYLPFVVKFDPYGNAIWAHCANTAIHGAHSCATSVSTDTYGNVFICGFFGDTIWFGTDTLRVLNQGVFLVKYDVNGNLKWAKQSAYNLNYLTPGDYSSVATDTKGNVYLCDTYFDSIRFDTTLLQTNYLNGGGAFLMKFDSLGNVVWGKSDSGGLIPRSLCCDIKDNIYETGVFQRGSVYFGPTLLTTASAGNIFYEKYNSAGEMLWAKCPSVLLDTDNWYGYGVAVDTVGGVYLATGCYAGTSDYGIAFDNDTISYGIENRDGVSVLVKMDSSGRILNCAMIPAGADDQNAIAVDPTGNCVYLSGDYWNNFVVGPDSIFEQSYEAPFIAKWGTNVITGTDGENSIKLVTFLFPNPNKGNFNLQISSFNIKNLTVEIYNMLGERIYKEGLPNYGNNININLGQQNPGVYLYRILDGSSNSVGDGKFIITE